MIQFEKIYKHLKKIKIFEKNKSKVKVLTFTVTPHWHNYLLLISGILSARGIVLDYVWNDFYTHDNKDTSNDKRIIKDFFSKIEKHKINKNLNFINVNSIQKYKLPKKLIKIIEKQSEIDTSNHFRRIKLDKKKNIYREIYSNKLSQNIKLASKILYLVKKNNYSSAIVPAGSFLYEWGVVYKTLRFLKINCCSIDYNLYGGKDKQLSVSWNYSSVIKDDYQFRNFNKYFRSLTKNEKEKIINESNSINKKFKLSFKSYWHNKKYNTNPGTQIVNQEKETKNLYKKLNIEKNHKIVLLLPSHGYEQHYRMKNQIFDSYISWLNKTISRLIKMKNLTIIVRCHPFPYNPNRDVIRYSESDEASLNILKKNKFYSNSNLKIIFPFDRINTYDLIKICDLGIVYTSLSGLEMAMIGKKPIVCTNTSYSKEKYVSNPKNEKNYFKSINLLLKKNSIGLNDQNRAKIFYHYFTNVLPKNFPWCFIKNGYYYNEFDFFKALSLESLFSEYIDTFDDLVFSKKKEKEKFKKKIYINYINLIDRMLIEKNIFLLKNCIFNNYKKINYIKIKKKYPEIYNEVIKNKIKLDKIYFLLFKKKEKKLNIFQKILKNF